MICGPINEALDVTVEVVFVRRWSTIAAQLPGRTDNEIKNHWNTHLKKQLLRMGLNPDTYASNASPCSSPSPSTRHMAQWESARLEAEARLSRESLLFSSSSNSASASSSTPSSSTALSASNSTLFTSKPEPDFFLRIWHSEVGDAFRKAIRESADSSLDSSSTKQSFAVVAPAVAEGERREETEIKICGAEASAAAVGSDSSSSYGMEEDASEETYRLYLDFTNDDMALFHGHMAGFSLFSDLNEASLDTAFK